MLRITRAANGEVVFRLSGRMDAEGVGELEGLFKAEANGRRIVLDLKDLTLADREAVVFLAKCERNADRTLSAVHPRVDQERAAGKRI